MPVHTKWLKGGGHVHFHNVFLAPTLSLGDVETQNNIFISFRVHQSNESIVMVFSFVVLHHRGYRQWSAIGFTVKTSLRNEMPTVRMILQCVFILYLSTNIQYGNLFWLKQCTLMRIAEPSVVDC